MLARELTIEEIKAVRAAVPADTVIEHFIHGALCVAYSGQCYISHAHTGRCANRGDCSQACRLPYTLQDAKGQIVAFEKHLLSVKDNNQSDNLRALIDAGVRSFKIEGRYKDAPYVKNITGHYRQLLDEILNERPELHAASSGKTKLLFTPDPDKTFHRGATDYFSQGRKADIGAFDTPTFVGLELGTVTQVGDKWFEMEANEELANSDGLNYLHKREVIGLQANVVEHKGKVWRIFPNEPMHTLQGLRPGVAISRNRDHAWEQALNKKSAERRVGVTATFAETADGFSLTLQDEDGIVATASAAFDKQPAKSPEEAEDSVREQLARFGNTDFELVTPSPRPCRERARERVDSSTPAVSTPIPTFPRKGEGVRMPSPSTGRNRGSSPAHSPTNCAAKPWKNSKPHASLPTPACRARQPQSRPHNIRKRRFPTSPTSTTPRLKPSTSNTA